MRRPGRVAGSGRSEESGQALVLALLVLALLTGVLALISMLLVSRMGEVRDEGRRVVLTALTDGALAETLARLASTPSFPGLDEQRMGEGIVESRVGRAGPSTLVIEVDASYRGAYLQVEARALERERAAPRVVSWRVTGSGRGSGRGDPEGDGSRGGRTPGAGR